uniref:FAD-binding domain-containing protein n=1 Tax=Mycena chlorophos TaxID=658473 RepID=A0ABQ0LY74_MYCCL|nr:FAD-binding domain-containing protein [Mycena chlorophos]
MRGVFPALLLWFSAVYASHGLAPCLSNAGLSFEIAQNSTWAADTTAFNTRLHYVPSAIVYPTTAAGVSSAVKCAVQAGMHVSPLSGGHSYSASGFGAQNGSLVVNFRDMSNIMHDAKTQQATIQSGARLGDVALALNASGRALAHGVCPYVGVGGHSAFGGFGYSSRSWGLLMDQVISVEMVLANGSIVHASSDQNAELFWASRGAAPSFGIITQYTYQTHQAPSSVVRFSFSFSNPSLSPQKFAHVLSAYQDYGGTAPKAMGISANVWDSGRTVELGGYYMGSMVNFNKTATDLLAKTGMPDGWYVQERSWIQALVEVNGGSSLDTTTASDTHTTFYAKSLVSPIASPLSNKSLEWLAGNFTKPLPSGYAWFTQFELWGGGDSAISSIPSTATAYPHRSHLFTMQFYIYQTQSGLWAEDATGFMNDQAEALVDGNPQTVFGAYANYIDPELAGWKDMYYAGNYDRLEVLRKAVDPDGVFMKPQSIGPSS